MSELFALGTDGQAFQLCSGTLISPTLFLTVAHCADYFNDFLAPQGFTLYLSFGNPIPILELTDVSTLIPVTQIIPYSKYVQATDTHPFNPHHGSDPGDLAVIILPLFATQGITPAALPTLGLLDELAAKNGGLTQSCLPMWGTGPRIGSEIDLIRRRECLPFPPLERCSSDFRSSRSIRLSITELLALVTPAGRSSCKSATN
jgi:hypothetical protein